MRLTCVVTDGTQAVPRRSIHGTRGAAQPPACGQPAAVLVLWEEEVWHAGDMQEDILRADPICADHAPEYVHETRSCMSEDEFTIVPLPKED